MKTVVRARSIGILTLFLLSIENVLALSTGLSPLDTAFNTIGNLFSINALQNEQVAVGVARFLWFVLIFAVLNWSGRNYVFKGDDGTNKKTANIVALVLAAISVFFVPMNVILAGTSGWGVILWSVLLLAPALVAVKFAFGGSKEKSAGDHIVDFVILLFALLWTWIMMGTLLEWYREQFPQTANSIDSVVGVAWLVLFFALLWKFFQIIGASGGSLGKAGSGIGSLFNRSGKDGNSSGKNSDGSQGMKPGPVQSASHNWEPDNGRMKIEWSPRSDDENIQQYQIRRRVRKFQGKNPNIFAGWKKIGTTKDSVYYDTGGPVRVLLNPRNLTYLRNRRLTPNTSYEYEVRAINEHGKGPWTRTEPGTRKEGDAEQAPGSITKVTHEASQNGIKIEWEPRPNEENVFEYIVERREYSQHLQSAFEQHNFFSTNDVATRITFLKRLAAQLRSNIQHNPSLFKGWEVIGRVKDKEYEDIGIPAEKALFEKLAHLTTNDVPEFYLYTVRAINSAGSGQRVMSDDLEQTSNDSENQQADQQGFRQVNAGNDREGQPANTQRQPVRPTPVSAGTWGPVDATEQGVLRNNGHDRKRVAKLIDEYVKDLQREMNDYGRETPWKWETRKTNNKHKEIIRLMDNAENKRYIDVQITSMKNALMQTPQTKNYANYFEDIIKHFFYGSEGANIEDKDINIDMVNTALKRFIELSDIKNHGGQ